MITLDNISRTLATDPSHPALESETSMMSWSEYELAVRRLLPWLRSAVPDPAATVAIEAHASIHGGVVAS